MFDDLQIEKYTIITMAVYVLIPNIHTGSEFLFCSN